MQLQGGGDGDREVENLDFFGTNDGVMLRMEPGAWSDAGFDDDDSDSEGDEHLVSVRFQGVVSIADLVSIVVACARAPGVAQCKVLASPMPCLTQFCHDASDERRLFMRTWQGGEGGAAPRPERDQVAYIMSLEQENMHLRQQNLDYREVCLLSTALYLVHQDCLPGVHTDTAHCVGLKGRPGVCQAELF